MPLIDVGRKAPAFSLKDQHGKTHRLADYAGQPVILYFYPKDDTPGCTREACAFRDNLPKFQTGHAVVLGVSGQSEASKAKFAGKYDLTFPVDLSRQFVQEFHRCDVPHQLGVLPCGHYTTGKAPFSYLDAYYLTSFFAKKL